MVGEPTLLFDPLPNDALRMLIEENVAIHTVMLTGEAEYFPVGYFLRGAAGDWVGGCLGQIWGGWLHVRWLWVTQSMRGKRCGSRLMIAAENYAIDRGAHWAMLETHNPEALRFYQAGGYEVYATLPDYPPGHSRYSLRKRLTVERG